MQHSAWGSAVNKLRYSKGSGLWQCPGCFRWLNFKEFVGHHQSYEPEIIVLVCRKCHAGIHKTGCRDGERKEWLEKKKRAAQEKKITKENLLKNKSLRKKYRQQISRRGSGRGWGALP